jgi:superfamily II DNA or RNA helicase
VQISQSDRAEPGRPRTDSVRVGDRVRVRHQRWVVTEIRAYEDCSALTLAGLGPDNLGLEQQILTPFDLVEPLTSPRSFRIVRATRWRWTCRQLIADSGPAGCLRTARSARMDLLPHQLEPALAIVHGRGTRILIADEVGLGKTVQAALIVAELKSRGAASRVLVLSPAGLREQWVDEFASRFGLRVALFDMATAIRQRASLPVGVNPWSVEPLIVTSIDYIKRPEVRPAVQACRWDVVVVDEAHHAAIGTDRHDAVHALCSNAPYVVLLTATPHNGDPQAFTSLCQLGQHDDALTVFRRTRQQVGHARVRRIHQLRVRPGAEERQMHAALDAFVRAVHREPDGRDQSTWLALSTLRKRALSSAFALLRSVEHRLSALISANDDGARQLTLPLFDRAGEFDTADDVPAWTIPALRDTRYERELLSRVARSAAFAVGRESKLAALARLLRRIAEPAIVFTEYRDTLVHVRERVAPGATILHGGLSREDRRAAIRAFREGGVLLATDAAGEGLNLHHNCRVVVNLELPWNPMRLEQRIGRVDRIGQTRTVHAFHLIAGGTAEVRVLQRLGIRIARAQADVGVPNPLSAQQPSDGSSGLATARMEAESSREHDRLTLARRVAPPASTASFDASLAIERHPLVTFTKRRAIRARLGSQVLTVFLSVLAEESGQPVAYDLLPVQLRFRLHEPWSLQQLESLGGLLTGDRRYNDWLTSSLAIHAAFWKTRLTRERSIANGREGMALAELQPGLFDLRAEHTWIDEEERRNGALREHARFATAAMRRATLVTDIPQIALVLFTR